MTAPIPVHLAVEDQLSETVARTLLLQSTKTFFVGHSFSRGGFGYLRSSINGFNNAARGCPFLVLTDLDYWPCFTALRDDWLGHPAHPNLLFRAAAREIEAWVLADREACGNYFGIKAATIPTDLDAVPDPKSLLLKLATRSRDRALRDDLVPPPDSLRTIGPNYNARLSELVRSQWQARRAAPHSNSLARALMRLDSFQPTWPNNAP